MAAKSDLPHVDQQHAREFAQSASMKFYEISVKDNTGLSQVEGVSEHGSVDDVLKTLANHLVEHNSGDNPGEGKESGCDSCVVS